MYCAFESFVIVMSIVNSYLDRAKATESGLPKLREEADMLFSLLEGELM